MDKKTIAIEAETLAEAKVQVQSQTPDGYQLLSEDVIRDGKPDIKQYTAITADDAFRKAHNQMAGEVGVIEKRVISQPVTETLTLEGVDESNIRWQLADKKDKQGNPIIIQDIRLIRKASKGLLGVGAKPAQYEVTTVYPAVVEVINKRKAKIAATFGEKKAEDNVSFAQIRESDSEFSLYFSTDPLGLFRVTYDIICHRCRTHFTYSNVSHLSPYAMGANGIVCPKCSATFGTHIDFKGNSDQGFRVFFSISPDFSPGNPGGPDYPNFAILGIERLDVHRSSGKIFQHDGKYCVTGAITFSPDDKYILSSDDNIRLWETESGQMIRKYLEESANRFFFSVAFSPDGQYIVGPTVSDVRVWETKSGQEIMKFNEYKRHQFRRGIVGLAFSPDMKLVFTAQEGIETTPNVFERDIRIWSLQTGHEEQRLKGQLGSTDCAAFSYDGKYALSGGGLGTIILWDVQKNTILFRHQEENKRIGIKCVAISPDSRFFAGSTDGKIHLWELETLRKVAIFENLVTTAYSITFSPSGDKLLSGHSDGYLRLWDIGTGKEIQEIDAQTGPIHSVAFSHDGRYVVSGSESSLIQLWQL